MLIRVKISFGILARRPENFAGSAGPCEKSPRESLKTLSKKPWLSVLFRENSRGDFMFEIFWFFFIKSQRSGLPRCKREILDEIGRKRTRKNSMRLIFQKRSELKFDGRTNSTHAGN
jgi:hypothetical protein